MNLNRSKFEKLVLEISSEVLGPLPDDLRENASDVIFSTADRPFKEDIDEDADYEDTLGLYDGVPVNERSVSALENMPSRITLYRLPLIDMCDNIRELRNEIRMTILHELGHHFGFDEDELEERGLG